MNQLNCKPFYSDPNHGRTCEIERAILNINSGKVNINASSDLVKYVLFTNSTLNFLPKEIFVSFQNVVMIGITKSTLNNLRSEKFFEEVSSLEKLRIVNSNISLISSETFKSLENLRWIRFSNVNLQHLPDGLFKYNEKLEYIDLYYNNIARIDLNVFTNLPRLREVDMRKNVCVDEQFIILKGNLSFMEEELFLCREPMEVTSETPMVHPDSPEDSDSYTIQITLIIIGILIISILVKRKTILNFFGKILK